MCEYWVYSCGHIVKTPCKLPKLASHPTNNRLVTVPENSIAPIQHTLNRDQHNAGESRRLHPSQCCPGFPTEPRRTSDKCFNCVFQDESINMRSMRPQVERLRIKREGAGNDNWGYSSQGMVGFGQDGNSSWLNQYGNQHGGFGTYLGGGRILSDKRQQREMMAPQQRPATGMRVMPPGGPQSWPYGPGGTLSNQPSSAGGMTNRSSSVVGFGSSASTNAVRSDSDGSAGSSSNSNASFMNPWAQPRSEMGHLSVPGGRVPAQSYGAGGAYLMPQMYPQGQPGPRMHRSV